MMLIVGEAFETWWQWWAKIDSISVLISSSVVSGTAVQVYIMLYVYQVSQPTNNPFS